MQLGCLLASLLLVASLTSAVPLPQEQALLGAQIDISNLENIGDITFDNIGSVLDILIKSGGTVQNVISQFQNINNNGIVKELVEEAKDIIERLKQGISEINEQHKTYAGEALKEMVFIKIQLKASRLSLNDLAKRTVFAVEDLKAFSKAFFDKNDEQVEEIVNSVDLRSGERICQRTNNCDEGSHRGYQEKGG